jgi:hypothetical protein
MLIGGLLFPLWYFGAARSPNTFLELSHVGLRRSIWGRMRFYRWEELGPIKARTRYRGSSYVWAELRNSPEARIIIDVSMGFRPGFLFGGLGVSQLAAQLNAWRASGGR